MRTKPRPEFVESRGTEWRHDHALTVHGERRADPIRSLTRADHDEGEDARTTRRLALVAATFDGRQRRSTPIRWLAEIEPDPARALRLWDAAQDARNRATVRALYESALPAPIVPVDAARRHVRQFELKREGVPIDAERIALDVLAIADDIEASHAYARELEKAAPEYARAFSSFWSRVGWLQHRARPDALTGRDSIEYRERRPGESPTLKRIRVADPHAVAYELAACAHHYATQAGSDAAEEAARRRAIEGVERSARDHAEPEGYRHGAPPPPGMVRFSRWFRLNPEFPDRPIAHSGRCGRSRIATISGRAPRYVSRLITDPERRIFSRTSRGTRALVVVDLSGSMSLDAEDLDRILEASVGATVVGYAAGNDKRPNCHVLAHAGRRVRHVVRYSSGNGVDAPAFVWACRKFARSSTPILWITDCQAVGNTGQNFEILDECRKVAKHYGARIERDLESAIGALDDLRRGKSRPSNPGEFSRVIEAKGYEPRGVTK